jgi:hypothetical protein
MTSTAGVESAEVEPIALRVWVGELFEDPAVGGVERPVGAVDGGEVEDVLVGAPGFGLADPVKFAENVFPREP